MATGEAWRSYYGRVFRKAWTDLGRHFVAQVVVSLVTAALGGAIALGMGVGDSSVVYALLGFAVWMVLAGGFYAVRAPVELDSAELVDRAAIEDSLLQLKQERERLQRIEIDFVKVGASRLPGSYVGYPDDFEVYIVTTLIYNRAQGGNFSASVVDQSARGLVEAYPMGSFPLRWQLPNMTEQQWIGQGCDGRLEVAWVFPKRRVVRFLGPGDVRWAEQLVDGDRVDGLIDVAVVGRDARQRVRFSLSIGTEDPVGLSMERVAHD